MSNKKYLKKEIIAFCEEAIKSPSTFYRFSKSESGSPIVNYKGKTKEGEYYTEIIANFLLNHIKDLENIEQITRKESYKRDTHDGQINENSNRLENNIAKQMFNFYNDKPFNKIGKIIDYETPLQNDEDDKEVGKIDLLGFNENEKTITFLELKRPDSDETLLRAILEIYTYRRNCDKDKLIKDFELPEHSKIIARPLIYEGSQAANEWAEIEKRENLKLLIKKLNIEDPIILTIPSEENLKEYKVCAKAKVKES